MIPLLFAVLLAPVWHPARPTVGDLVTIHFPVPASARVELKAAGYEVVKGSGGTVVIRAFKPGQVRVEGEIVDGGRRVPLDPVAIPIASVLGANDALKPAPLKAPIELPADRRPWLAAVIAAVCAAGIWAAVVLLGRRRRVVVSGRPAAPEDDFLTMLRALPGGRSPDEVIAAVADATRRYLSAIDEKVGQELTTSEILELLRDRPLVPEALVGEILRTGDLAKFSPWGAGVADPAPFVARARSMVRRRESAA